MHPIAVLIENMPIMECKRKLGLDFGPYFGEGDIALARCEFAPPLWMMLDETPYTSGEVKFAGWGSHDDNEKGKEYSAS